MPRTWGVGRKGTLHTEAPHAEARIISMIQSLRANGGTVNSITARSIIKAVITKEAPGLLNVLGLNRRWVRQWLQVKMSYAYRKGTTSGQKLPIDWEAQVTLMIDRVAAAVFSGKLKHPDLIINWDQSGFMLMPSLKFTYHRQDKNRNQQKAVPILNPNTVASIQSEGRHLTQTPSHWSTE